MKPPRMLPLLAAALTLLLCAGCVSGEPEVPEDVESVRYALWLTEQELYVAEGAGGDISAARSALDDAVSLLNTAEEPLLGPDDTLDEDQYGAVRRYLNAMRDYLAALPDDLSDVPEEDREDTGHLLRIFCATLRVNREASLRPTLASVHQNLQAFGTDYFLDALEAARPELP